MDFLWSMFKSPRNHRHFARVDASGICRAFKQCSQAPAGQEWVEITEQNLSWLGQSLPASARAGQRSARSSALNLSIA